LRPEWVRYPNGRKVFFDYGAGDEPVNVSHFLNWLNKIRDDDNGSAGDMLADKYVDFLFDAASQFDEIDRYADLAGTSLVAHTDYVFDNLGRLTDLTHLEDQTTFADYDLAYGVDACEHYLHSGDQVIETRQADLVAGVAPDADAIHPRYQNVWSLRYIDALMLRDENSDPATDDQCDNGRIFYLADANFNVTAIVAESSRGEEDWAVRERYVYTPYGAVTILDADFAPVTGNTSVYTTTTLYTGRRLDAETGLYYYRARYYHAQLGRFISRDPIGYDGGDANLYRYVGNAPTNARDPIGLAVDVGESWSPPVSAPGWQPPRLPAGPLDGGEGRYGFWSSGWTGQHSAPSTLGQLINDAAAFAENDKTCISELAIGGHASPWGIQLRSINVRDWPEEMKKDVLQTAVVGINNGAAVGAELKKLCFCCPCVIYLDGCNAGQIKESDPLSWPKQIADATGCTVIGPQGYSSGSYLTGIKNVSRELGADGRYYPSGPYTEEVVFNVTADLYGGEDGKHRIYRPNKYRDCGGVETRAEQTNAIINYWANYRNFSGEGTPPDWPLRDGE